MTKNIVEIVTLSKPFKLSNGMMFETRRELKAYIAGLKNAQGNMFQNMEMVINNASIALDEPLSDKKD